MIIYYEDNHLLVVEKPENVPMQADRSKDPDLLNMAKEYIKKKYNKPGEVYLGLVHRLDRPVGGICVFARTSKAAARLSEQIANHTFKKEYEAIVLDDKLAAEGCFVDRLIKDTKTNMVKVHPDGKEAILNYQVLERKNNWAKVKINLQTGRSHQIRVQFASRRHPLRGDQRYNPSAKPGQQIALHASRITFLHPTTKEELSFISHKHLNI